MADCAEVIALESAGETCTVEETVITVTVSGQGPPGPAAPAATLKAGSFLPSAFAGSPLSATVTFGTPFPSDQYSISVCFETVDAAQFTHSIENRTAAGFDVVLCTQNLAGLSLIGWTATQHAS